MALLHKNPGYQRKLKFPSSDEEEESVLFFAPMLNGTPGQDALLAPSLWRHFGERGDGNPMNLDEQVGAFPLEDGQGVSTGDYFHPYDTFSRFYTDEDVVKHEEENMRLTSSMMDFTGPESDPSWCMPSDEDYKPRPSAAGHYQTTDSDNSTEPVRSERTSVHAVMSKPGWRSNVAWRRERKETQGVMTAVPALPCRSSRHNRVSTSRRGKASSTSPQVIASLPCCRHSVQLYLPCSPQEDGERE